MYRLVHPYRNGVLKDLKVLIKTKYDALAHGDDIRFNRMHKECLHIIKHCHPLQFCDTARLGFKSQSSRPRSRPRL